MDRLLGKASRQTGRSRSEVARAALCRQLRLTQLEAVRRRMMPFAKVPLGDPANIAVVPSALNGGADILVTGDQEIVALKWIGPLQILTPRGFWKLECNGHDR